MIEISNRVYYLEHSTETDRPTLGYIKGDKYSFMMDAGNSSEHVKQFYKNLEELDLPKPDFVGITHSHWDHTFGLASIKAVSIASRLTNEILQNMINWEWTDEAMKQRLQAGEELEFCDIHIRKEYPNLDSIRVNTADITFDDMLSLDLGGVTCEMIRLGGPHTEDSSVIYIPEEKVIFMGDTYCQKIVNNEWVYDIDELQYLISALEDIDFDLSILGHHQPHTKEELLEFLRAGLN